MNLQVGKATKGTEARGPACDRISARSAEAILGRRLRPSAIQTVACQARLPLLQSLGAVPLPNQPMRATQNRRLAILAHICARTAGQRRGIQQRDLSRCSCRLRGVCSKSFACSRPSVPIRPSDSGTAAIIFALGLSGACRIRQRHCQQRLS